MFLTYLYFNMIIFSMHMCIMYVNIWVLPEINYSFVLTITQFARRVNGFFVDRSKRM